MRIPERLHLANRTTPVQKLERLSKKIGKGIEDYNCFDTGIFLCDPLLFSAIEKSSREAGDDSLSGGVRILAKEGHAKVMPINGLFWCDIDDPQYFKQAEKYLSDVADNCAK